MNFLCLFSRTTKKSLPVATLLTQMEDLRKGKKLGAGLNEAASTFFYDFLIISLYCGCPHKCVKKWVVAQDLVASCLPSYSVAKKNLLCRGLMRLLAGDEETRSFAFHKATFFPLCPSIHTLQRQMDG